MPGPGPKPKSPVFRIDSPEFSQGHAAALQFANELFAPQPTQGNQGTAFGAAAESGMGPEAAAATGNMGLAAGQFAAHTLGSLVDWLAGRKTVQDAQPGVKPLDLTDPTVDPGDHPLTPQEQSVRNLRRFIYSSGKTLGLGGGMFGSAATQRMEQEGQLAPARTREEQIIDTAVPMVQQLGLFAGAGVAGAAAGATGATGAAVAGAGDLAADIGGRQLAKTGLERFFTTDLEELGGKLAGLKVGPGAGFMTPGGANTAGRVLAALGTDAGIGAGLGAAEGWGLQQTAPSDQPVSNEEVHGLIRNYALFGAGLGALMRAPTILNSAAAVTRLLNTPADGILTAGAEIGERVKVRTARGLQWKWKPGTIIDGQDVGNRWASPPSPMELQQATRGMLQKARGIVTGTDEGASIPPQIAQADVSKPADMPPDINSPKQQQAVQLMAAKYYMDTAPGVVRQMHPDVFERQKEALKDIIFDTTEPESVRMSAQAKLMAFQRVKGELSTGTMEGVLPFDADVAALQQVRSTMTGGKLAVRQRAMQVISEGQPEVGYRMLDIIENAGQGQDLKLGAEMDELAKRMTKRERAYNRGMAKGTLALNQDGHVLQLATDPTYGLARVQNTTTGAGPDLVDVNDLTPFPKVKRSVRLKDGTVGRVTAVDTEHGVATIKNAINGTLIPNVKFSDIADVGNSLASVQQGEFARQSILASLGEGDTAETASAPAKVAAAAPQTAQDALGYAKTPFQGPESTFEPNEPLRGAGRPSAADRAALDQYTAQFEHDTNPLPVPQQMGTRAGEPVTVERVGQHTAIVKTASGARKAVPVDQLQRTTRSGKPAPGGAREIVDFAPGTVPDRDPARHKILFLSVPKDQAAEFEAMYKAGKDVTPYTQLGFHVLPHTQPGDGFQTYAIEAPSKLVPQKAYSQNAKNALAALGGTDTVGTFESRVGIAPNHVMDQSRVYRVPDELHASAMKSEKALKLMPQAEQTSYLRNLINYNSHVDTQLSAATTAVQTAVSDASAAAANHDGAAFLEAETQRGQGIVDALKAAVKSESDADFINGVSAAVDREAKARDPHAAAKERFTAGKGTADDWHKALADLQPTGSGVSPDEQMMLLHRNEPGQRLFISKHLEPTVNWDPRGGPRANAVPGTNELYKVVARDGEGRDIPGTERVLRSQKDLDAHVQEQGYIPSNTKIWNPQYATAGGNRHARIVPMGTQFHVLEEAGAAPETVETTSAKAQVLKDLAPRAEVNVGIPAKDAGSGTLLHHEVAKARFNSVDEAEQWLRKNQFKKVETSDVADLSKRFAKLPAVHDLNVDNIEEVHDELHNIMSLSQIFHKSVPPAIKEYASEFMDKYADVKHLPAFDRHTRFILDRPTIADTGPSSQPHTIDTSRFADDVAKLSVDRPSPDVVRPGSYASQHMAPKQMMHLSAQPPAMYPRDYTAMYRDLHMIEQTVAPEAEAAQGLEKALSKQTDLTEVYRKLRNKVKGEQGALTDLNLGTYSPTGQVVEITGAEPTNPGEMTVKFPSTGQELTVDANDVEPARAKARTIDDFRMAKALRSGRYEDYIRGRIAPAGYGQVEANMGLLGSRPEVVQSAMANRSQELAQDLKLYKTNGLIHGPRESIDELQSLFRRAQELDSMPITPQTAGKFPEKSFEEALLGPIRELGPGAERAFRYSVYWDTIRSLGGGPSTPYAELIARARAGRPFLKEADEKVLREWAGQVGLSKDLPPARIAHEVMARKVYDPTAAQLAIHLSDERGFIGFLKDTQAPVGSMTIRFPRRNDILLAWNMNIPWKTMARHPLTRMVQDMLDAAGGAEQQEIRAGTAAWKTLLEHGYKNDDIDAIGKALGKHETFQEALDAGAVTDKHRFGFEQLRTFLQGQRENVIRHFLRRQVNAVPYDPTNLAHQKFVHNNNIPADKLAKGAYLMAPTRSELIGSEGMQTGRLTEDQIERFIELQRSLPGSEALTDANLREFPQWEPDQLRQNLDFYKTYGIKNYWPLVHEGNMLVTVNREGAEQALGWATSLPDVLNIVQHMVKEGKLATNAEGLLAEDVRVVHNNPIFDDIMQKGLKDGREWATVAQEVAKGLSLDPDQVRALVLRTTPTGRRVAAPNLVHAKARIANLEPPMRNFAREFATYNARLARMNYRWKVMEADRLLNDTKLDNALSQQYGVNPVIPGMGNRGLKRLHSYARDQISTALGEPTIMEKITDDWLGLANFLDQAPAASIQKFMNEHGVPGVQPIPVSYKALWQRDLWDQPFLSRRLAADVVGAQSILRLGFSAGSAVSNATQYWVNTVPKFMGQGLAANEAMALGVDSWKKAINLAYHKISGGQPSEEMNFLAKMVDEAGVDLMPSKYEMGGHGSSWAGMLQRPNPLGQSKAEFALALSKHYAMLPFQVTEDVNRFGTAIGAYHIATKVKGMPHDAAVLFAKNMIRETQFQYDELAIPNLIRQFGPAAKVLFQFKPFLFNMLSFEKDLLAGTLRGDPGALTQLAGHVAGLTAFSGVVGLAANPLWDAISTQAELYSRKMGWGNLTLSPAKIQAMQSQKRMGMADATDNFTGSWHHRADDLLLYGVPGLLGLSLGNRAGIAGQDFANLFTLQGLGPQYSIYLKAAQAAKAYEETARSGPGILGGAIGGTIAPVALRMMPGLRGAAGLPFAEMLSTIAGASIGSHGGPNPFTTFLAQSREGRAFIQSLAPTFFKNAYNTWNLHRDGFIRSLSGEPVRLQDADPSSFIQRLGALSTHPTGEEARTFFGLPGIKRDEYNAVIGLMGENGTEYSATQSEIATRAARAYIAGDLDGAFQAILDGQRMGINVNESAIQTKIQDLTTDRLQTFISHQPSAVRTVPPESSPTNP